MMRQCVVLKGKVINIGEWDYKIEEVEIKPVVVDPITLEVIEPAEYEKVVINPMPDGATIEERNITLDDDGGLRETNDYASLRKVAYPKYSPFDILDELLKEANPTAGSKLAQIIEERNLIKQKYPKMK